jgi:hypothetical protein
MEVNPETYIKKLKQGDSLYEKLYQEGLEIVQNLSGGIWTDFNEHDPGVTILENIIYALTELDYKAKLPIKDLLIEAEGKQLSSGDNGLYIASDILTTGPITVLDFRKLFYDEISNVKNVWMETVNEEDDASLNIKGLYHLYLEMYTYDFTPDQLEAEIKRIKKEAKDIFNKHRNFCQDLLDINILDQLSLKLSLTITLVENADAETVLASIIYKTIAIITNQINYYSLEELQLKELSVEEIYDGPNLNYGFILDEDLQERSNVIVFADIVKVLIAEIPGILQINYFKLDAPDAPKDDKVTVTEKQISFHDTYAPNLIFPKDTAGLNFFYGSTPFQPNLKETSSILANKQGEDSTRFRTVSQAMKEIPIPEGTFQDVASYLSVRHQFPITYGIGEDEIYSNTIPGSNIIPANGNGHSKQLKAFLLLFDQVMANYLKQLSVINTLFSDDIDSIQSPPPSYYFQELDDMKPLSFLMDEEKTANGSKWNDVLSGINSTFDLKAIDRLNHVADNILARYCEEFNTYSLQKINDISYGENPGNAAFKWHLLKWKRKLIQHYSIISMNRAKAYDYTSMPDNKQIVTGQEDLYDSFIPGLIHKITILMGIENCNIRPLTEVIKNSDITVLDWKHGRDFISEEMEFIFPEKETEIMVTENIFIVSEHSVNSGDALLFPGNKKTILKDLLKNGVQESNYEIKQDSNKAKNKFYILFTGSSGSHLMFVASSLKEASKIKENTISYLTKLSEDSEGMFLVEHILLAPPYLENYFGFRMEISGSNIKKPFIFVQKDKKNMLDRNKDVAGLLDFKNIKVEQNHTDKGWFIELRNSSEKLLAVSEHTFKDKSQSDQYCKDLTALLSDSTSVPSVHTTFLSYLNEHAINETFFSFRMSFILPDWPARFQTKLFQEKFNNIVCEQAPVHVVSDIYWWDMDRMMEFEKVYFEWIKLQTNEDDSKQRMDYAIQLINMLHHKEKNEHR